MSEAQPLVREVRWPTAGVLAGFLVLGAFTRRPPDLALSVIGTVVALGAGSMVCAGIRPRTALALALLAGVGVVLAAGTTGHCVAWFGLCVLAFCAVIACGPRLGAVFVVAALAPLAGHLLSPRIDAGWLPWMAGVVVSAGAAVMIAHERALTAELRAAHAGLAERSRAEERNRIARDLHDVIAHTLTVSLLHVSSARLAVEHDPADAARSLEEAERLGRESLDEVRSIVGMLRSDADRGSTAPVPGVSAIPDLIERFRAAGAEVTLARAGELERLPATSGATIYRILQEALTNAVRHAPGSAVTVRLAAVNGEAVLDVDSAGAPNPSTPTGGTGLAAMRERAEAVGGRCEAGPGADGAGWRVHASVPVGRAR